MPSRRSCWPGRQPAERVLLDAYLRAARQQGRAVVALDGLNRLVSEAAGRLLSPEGLEALERGVVALLRDANGGGRAGGGRPGGEGFSATTAPDAVAEAVSGATAEPDPGAAPVAVAEAVTGTTGPDPRPTQPGSRQLSGSGRVRVPRQIAPVSGFAVGAVGAGAARTSGPHRSAGSHRRSQDWVRRHAVGRAIEFARSSRPAARRRTQRQNYTLAHELARLLVHRHGGGRTAAP